MVITREMTPVQEGLYATAKRIARRDGVTDPEALAAILHSLCYKQWRCAVQPWLDLKAKILGSRVTSKIMYFEDGSVRVEYEHISSESQRALDFIDEALKQEAIRYGLQRPE